jgi:hypothetical protein
MLHAVAYQSTKREARLPSKERSDLASTKAFGRLKQAVYLTS